MTAIAPVDGDRPFTIRQAEPADLLAVHRIEQRSFPQPWPYAAFQGFLGEPGFLVAAGGPGDVAPGADGPALGEDLAGYIVADVTPNHGRDIGHVKDIAVAPECRGEGVGRALLSRGLAALAGQGARSAKLEVRATNEPALGLYRAFGFEHRRTVPGYYDDGEDAYVLVRALDA